MSKRQKRRIVNEGVASLKRKTGWDPANHHKSSPEERLRELDQDSQNKAVYDSSKACEACREARESSGDVSALCDAHLSEALGF